MEINPYKEVNPYKPSSLMDHISNERTVSKPMEKITPSGKAETDKPLSPDVKTGNKIQDLKKMASMEISSRRASKIQEAQKLLESGKINDRAVIEKTAQKMLGSNPLEADDLLP